MELQPSRYRYPRSAECPTETGKATVETVTGKFVTEVAASTDNAMESGKYGGTIFYGTGTDNPLYIK